MLGQSNAAAATLTDLYTVPSVTSATTSSLLVCNRNAAAATYRVAVAVAGAVDDPKHYLYYDTPLLANDTFAATIGATLASADVVRVSSNLGGVTFTLFGVEVT